MLVSDLYAPHGPFVGQDFFVIGTGPSMGLMPRSMLHGKTCVLLNDAARHFPDLGPIAFSNNLGFVNGCPLPYVIVKGRLKHPSKWSASNDPSRDDNHCRWNNPDRYVFSYREPPWDKASHHDERTLWAEPCHYWAPRKGSCSAFAVQFALHAGARSITLVGCDCNDISGADYVEGKGSGQVSHCYRQYAYGLERLWVECQKRGVPLVSLTPFFGLGWHEQQFREMTEWQRKSVSTSAANGAKSTTRVIPAPDATTPPT